MAFQTSAMRSFWDVSRTSIAERTPAFGRRGLGADRLIIIRQAIVAGAGVACRRSVHRPRRDNRGLARPAPRAPRRGRRDRPPICPGSRRRRFRAPGPTSLSGRPPTTDPWRGGSCSLVAGGRGRLDPQRCRHRHVCPPVVTVQSRPRSTGAGVGQPCVCRGWGPAVPWATRGCTVAAMSSAWSCCAELGVCQRSGQGFASRRSWVRIPLAPPLPGSFWLPTPSPESGSAVVSCCPIRVLRAHRRCPRSRAFGLANSHLSGARGGRHPSLWGLTCRSGTFAGPGQARVRSVLRRTPTEIPGGSGINNVGDTPTYEREQS